MEINFSIRHRQGQSAERTVKLQLIEGRSIIIGRSPTSDLRLEDTERVISSQHVRLDLREDVIWVTDTSRNGTYLNDAADPLPASRALPVDDGDRLLIGSYEVYVQLSASANLSIKSTVKSQDESESESATDLLNLFDPTGQWRHSANATIQSTSSTNTQAPHQQNTGERLQTQWSAANRDSEALLHSLNQPPAVDHAAETETNLRPLTSLPLLIPSQSVQKNQSIQQVKPISLPEQPKEHRTESIEIILKAFFTGLGLEHIPAIENHEALLQRVGELVRALAGGLNQIMLSRAQFKSELGLGVTTIRPAANNPFKFSVDANEVLERLLFRPHPGFLPAAAAAREAFEDIQAHEMAITAGLRAALRTLFARFEPTTLIRQLGQPSVLEQLIPLLQKAHAWELFTKLYQDIAKDATEDFMQLFEDAFARAYQEQIRRLEQVRR